MGVRQVVSGRRVASLIVVALAGAPQIAMAEPVSLRMEMFGPAGVPVLTLHTHLDETAGGYSVGVDYATTGMAKVFVDIHTRSEVQGRMTATQEQPVSFRADSTRNGTERHSRVDYRPDGTVIGGSTPPLPQPVAEGLTRGTVDNLTAYFRLERQLARTGSCAMRVAVFDGRHRYDLQFSDAGHRALTPSGGQNYQGDAIACRMVRVERESNNDEQNEGATGGTLWYARLVPGDELVPVRMQMDTQLGVVDAYLAEIRGRGVNLKLMQ
ncbi:MAG: DUF3108 domain-containing protein [Alphaproteobacteria bacterium]|nr:DUF3108 domain-containing protein [Alphaproteobacteria bacterium]